MRLRVRLLLAILGATMAVAPVRAFDEPTPPTTTGPWPLTSYPWDGMYACRVSGYYSGKGTFKITQGKLQVIQCKVTTPDGTVFPFHTQQPLVIDKGYFSGAAMIGSLNVTISGRVDAPAPGENLPLRICATFVVEDGHGGRLVGGQQ